MNYDALSPAASLSPPSISSGDTDSDDQRASSPSNSYAYYQPNTSHSSSSSHTSVSESPNLDFAQYLPDIGLQATMQELGMSIDGWEQWNDKPIDPAMLFVDLDGLGGGMPVTPATTHSTLSPANLPITPPAPVGNPGVALPKNKFSTARASHLLSVPRAPSPEIRSTKAEPLSAADDIAQRILARTRPAVSKQPQQLQPQSHVPGAMPGIVMPSLPPVPRSGVANTTGVPNMQDMNAFMPMQLDPNEAALTNEYIAMLQNAQSMPDFFSTAFNTPPAAPQQPPSLPTLPNTSANGNQAASQAAPPLRTKTSHTTIERRYRTNLNTRITALRHAVPALRVLDKAAFPNEQPDEHGLCDGVRPARKASKASVLGKATEYIRVLKRREKRLDGAVGGLKALVRVLSGEQVVREWEAEWVRVHGGPETDSIGVDADGNDAEGDGDDDDSDGDEPKAKRTKAASALSVPSPAAAPLAAGEKRKRGRPRKSPQTETFPQSVVAIAPAPASSSGENGKYLLGVFLFFSFFKGGARHTPAHGHTHVGSVISRAGSVISSPSEAVQSPWDFAHLMHTVLSIVLLAWVVWGWITSLTEARHKKGEGRIKIAKNVLAKGRSASALTRAWAAAQLYFTGPESGALNEIQWDAVLGLLLAPICAPLARRFWARARESLDYTHIPVDADNGDSQTLLVDNGGEDTPLSSGFLTPRPSALDDTPDPNLVRRAVLGLDVEDAEAGYVSALSGSGIAGDETSTDDVLDFIAAAQVWVMSDKTCAIRQISSLPGHEDRAWQIAWNPESALLASCSTDKTVRLYSYSTPGSNSANQDHDYRFAPATTIATGHTRTVRAIAWAPGGKSLAVGSFDSNVSIWERSAADSDNEGEGQPSGEWEMVSQLEGHENECKSVAYSHGGTLLASCSRDKSVWIWEVQPDAEFECLSVMMEHSQDVKAVTFHPQRDILASASYDDTIKLYVDDPSDDWYPFATLKGHSSTVWSVAFSPCGRYLASASDDKTIRVWKHVASDSDIRDPGDWRPALDWEAHSRPVYSISWGKGKSTDLTDPASDLGWIASAGGDGRIRIWKVGKSLFPLPLSDVDLEVFRYPSGNQV
ncbi:Cytosolic iron-sulfur protein assembly protein [Ceratobasidium sp. 392]|nr:Cytosolic iron-sulfur protein assembly protein [Ceratobasidium sp. 392]